MVAYELDITIKKLLQHRIYASATIQIYLHIVKLKYRYTCRKKCYTGTKRMLYSEISMHHTCMKLVISAHEQN
jgi:hypothetical protein